MAAPPLLLRSAPVLRLRLHLHLRLHHRLFAGGLRPLCAAAAAAAAADASTEPASPGEKASSEDKKWGAAVLLSTKEPPRYQRWDDPDFRKWKDKEDEILRDIEPTVSLAKEILHSDRYLDGEQLTAEDEKTVVEKLLIHHPHAEDKIGCGLDYIMVERHPQFRISRCLFVVRTDGAWIDFSYQKCLRAYIRLKYPSYAERFIREHFKRGSG
ncbi:protein DCL homolog, chloroplastic-like [Eucalyptus grandis]|uniref:protein DCL homolog, chloroplastic-like n=1 Tax=Eucalyptus grandis TaxID=71139 RepID=UPI00192EFCA1|nr:protein DCL homolog, chloroplastic-like [Eucalyptus grandis]XP_039172064.1 protein DCL homolog, chloroplastic-like [Eucalyptus grandis]